MKRLWTDKGGGEGALIICKQISMLITLMISWYLMLWLGLGGFAREGWLSRSFSSPPPPLSLCLSHLNGTAKWWSNLSDLWLGAGPDIIACHSRTEWGRGGWVCAAPRNTKYPPPRLSGLSHISLVVSASPFHVNPVPVLLLVSLWFAPWVFPKKNVKKRSQTKERLH